MAMETTLSGKDWPVICSDMSLFSFPFQKHWEEKKKKSPCGKLPYEQDKAWARAQVSHI